MSNMTAEQGNRLFRPQSGRVLLGVCAGLGRYFDFSPWLIRLVFVLMFVPGIIAYIVLAILVDEEE